MLTLSCPLFSSAHNSKPEYENFPVGNKLNLQLVILKTTENTPRYSLKLLTKDAGFLYEIYIAESEYNALKIALKSLSTEKYPQETMALLIEKVANIDILFICYKISDTYGNYSAKNPHTPRPTL